MCFFLKGESMKTVTFSCETITPMFMYGADSKTPELRPASIKGVMRFWWRAINGDLPLDKLKKQEYEIFGSTEKKSSFSIKIKNYRFQNNKILGTFEIKFLLSNRCDFDIENFFKMVVLLGGFGKSAKKQDKGKIKIIQVREMKRTG
jgi:CRISPR type III-B/RAMP module RAMP protein Cmr1